MKEGTWSLRLAGGLAVAAAIVVATLAAGQASPVGREKSTVEGSPHDLRVYVGVGGTIRAPSFTLCDFCHTAHGRPPENALDPLWNHTLSSVSSYDIYLSDTLDAIDISDLGAGGTNSNLCLSCHDGTVAINSQYNPGGDVGLESIPQSPQVFIAHSDWLTAQSFRNLSDDHPVNFVYDPGLAQADGGLRVPAEENWVDTERTIPLFDRRLQCSSCHDAHNGTGGVPYRFLRRRLDESRSICLECHL